MKKHAKKAPPKAKQGKRAAPATMPSKGRSMRHIPDDDMPMDERLMARKSGPRVM